MVILIGTETEWSISPSERYYKKNPKDNESEEEGRRVVNELADFIAGTQIELNDINSLFLRLCDTKPLDREMNLRSFKSANNDCYTESGFRIYKDPIMHLESCTPECNSIFDVVEYEKASELLVLAALRKYEKRHSREEDNFTLLKNNTDGKRSWAAHENYGISKNISGEMIDNMIPFLVTRIVYTGCGHMRMEPFTTGIKRSIDDYFELSPRAPFIIKIKSCSATESERSIIQQKEEPLMDSNKYQRFHISCGDPSMFPYTNALKLGTTKVVLELLEEDKFFNVPELSINAVEAIKEVSMHPYKTLEFKDGQNLSAINVQKKFYLEPALKILKGKNSEIDWVLDNWVFALDQLQHSKREIPKKFIGYLDWPTKRYLLSIFKKTNRLNLSDNGDLEQLVWKSIQFHDVDPASGLLYPYGKESYYPTKPDNVLYAIFNPPFNTRAGVRGVAIKHFSENISFISWEQIKSKKVYDKDNKLNDGGIIDLNNLISTNNDELEKLYREDISYDKFIKFCKKHDLWRTENERIEEKKTFQYDRSEDYPPPEFEGIQS